MILETIVVFLIASLGILVVLLLRGYFKNNILNGLNRFASFLKKIGQTIWTFKKSFILAVIGVTSSMIGVWLYSKYKQSMGSINWRFVIYGVAIAVILYFFFKLRKVLIKRAGEFWSPLRRAKIYTLSLLMKVFRYSLKKARIYRASLSTWRQKFTHSLAKKLFWGFILSLFTYIPYKLFGNTGLEIEAEFLIFAVLMTAIILGISWKTGYLATLFFPIETGNIGFVDAGETNVFTYINIPGKVLRDGVEVNGKKFDGVIVDEEYPGQWLEEKTFIQKTWGQYWIGFKFLGRKVHRLEFTKERENPRLSKDMEPAEWIERDAGIFRTNELRSKFPRPVLVPDLKFADNIEANILAQCNLEVLIPKQLVYMQKGNFFNVIVSYVRTGVNDFCQKITANTFNSSKRIEGSDFSNEIVLSINTRLQTEVGVTLKGVSVPIYNTSSDEEEEALKAAEIARLEGLATIAKEEADAKALIVKAKAEAEKTIIDAKALAEADVILGQASVADVMATADHFKKIGADPDVAAHSATMLGRAKRFSKENSPVQTLVEGQSTIAVPPSTPKRVVLASQ